MDPRKRMILLFTIGVLLGGILAALIWTKLIDLGNWTVIGVLFAVGIAMGTIIAFLFRRQNRRR